MDPKEVRLSLIVRLKVLFSVFVEDDDGPVVGILFLIYLLGLGMALCVPSFMIGVISQFIMTFILSLVFSAVFIGLIAGGAALWEEKFENIFSRMNKDYKEKLLPLQKAELEKVDDILLR